MLELHFINVADGDAILVEQRQDGNVFRLLVDTGRPEMAPVPGSLRCTDGEYLAGRGITFIDALVVTHLHVDHFGGLAGLLDRVSFADAYAGYFPQGPCALDRQQRADIKTGRSLADCLEQWAADTERLARAGTRLHPVDDGVTVSFTPQLTGQIRCPDPSASGYQHGAWTDMLAGRPVPAGMQYWSSKYRNPGSLRVRLAYAGRRIELAGDCYGAAWEDQAEPCDIFKVPHHGDAKSMTRTLAARLRPAWAVISCGAIYNEKKDRPSKTAVEILREQGAQVYFTDSFSAPWQEPEYRRTVDFTIEENGDIHAPGRQT